MAEEKKENKKEEMVPKKVEESVEVEKEKVSDRAEGAESKEKEDKKDQTSLDQTKTGKSKGKEESSGETKKEEGKPKKKKKKAKKNVPLGTAYVKATFNNTIITITDPNGNVLTSSSAGVLGYSGTKKSTPYVAGLAANSVADKAKSFGMSEINVFVKGIGSGRESAVRALQSSGLNVLSIKDITPLPHNGCRRKKIRRV